MVTAEQERHRYVWTVTDEALAPRIVPGDTILIDPREPVEANALLMVEHHGLWLVRWLVERRAGELVLEANDGQPAIPLAEVAVLGVVVEMHRPRMTRHASGGTKR